MSGVGNPKGVGGYIKRLIPQGFHSRPETAKLIGVHVQTLIRWENNGTIKPDAFMETGKQSMPLYLDATIEKHRKE